MFQINSKKYEEIAKIQNIKKLQHKIEFTSKIQDNHFYHQWCLKYEIQNHNIQVH